MHALRILILSHLIFSRLQYRTLREEHGSIAERDLEPEAILLQVIVLLGRVGG